MIAIPVSLLALAAGVALLIKVKTVALGALYRGLSWLVILLSLLYMLCIVAMGVMHHRHMANMNNDREARFKEFRDIRMKYWEHMKGDSAVIKGDSRAMIKDSTINGRWHAHMMAGNEHSMGARYGQMERGHKGGRMRGHHHHHQGGMRHYHEEGMYGMHRDWHKKHGEFSNNAHMPKDSTATAIK